MDYIIKNKNKTFRYYYDEKNGLMLSEGNCFPPVCIKHDATEIFSVYEKDTAVHIICVNNRNEIVYVSIRDAVKREYVLCELKDEFSVKHIFVAEAGAWMNLLYCAEYKGEILLIHCILGNHAKPEVIDKLKNPHFYVFKNRVYYTSSEGNLGYRELFDGKPDGFVLTAEGAEDVYLCEYDGKEYIVYRRGDGIFVNHVPKINDSDASMPIVVKRQNEPTLMWKSGGIIKFAGLSNTENVKKLLTSGRNRLFCVCENGKSGYDYYFPGEPESEDINTGEVREIAAAVLGIKEEIQALEEKIRKMSKRQ